MASYYVKAPLIQVTHLNGKIEQLLAPRAVPTDVSQEDLDRLEEGGLIAKVEETVTAPRVGRPAKGNDSAA
ncbi:hypothetical protein [Rhodococcoides fascians]|uniref:hypothetical protein n=1 Tax=Rhodococcoides fascians TaxID=1828 RepID=UPI00050CA444|nr:hypothetical protein [Rhodococcus fascians]